MNQSIGLINILTWWWHPNPKGDTNICTKFHSNPSDICRDISLKTTLGSWWKIGGSPKSLEFILWGPWVPVQNFMPIHQLIVEILVVNQPTDRPHWQTNMAIPRAMPWLKILEKKNVDFSIVILFYAYRIGVCGSPKNYEGKPLSSKQIKAFNLLNDPATKKTFLPIFCQFEMPSSLCTEVLFPNSTVDPRKAAELQSHQSLLFTCHRWASPVRRGCDPREIPTPTDSNAIPTNY